MIFQPPVFTVHKAKIFTYVRSFRRRSVFRGPANAFVRRWPPQSRQGRGREGGRGRGRRCDGDRRPSSSGESVPRRGRREEGGGGGGGGGGKVGGTRGRGGEIGERPGRPVKVGVRRRGDVWTTDGHISLSPIVFGPALAPRRPARPFLVCVPLNAVAAAVVTAVRGARIVVGMTAQSGTSDRGRDERRMRPIL